MPSSRRSQRYGYANEESSETSSQEESKYATRKTTRRMPSRADSNSAARQTAPRNEENNERSLRTTRRTSAVSSLMSASGGNYARSHTEEDKQLRRSSRARYDDHEEQELPSFRRSTRMSARNSNGQSDTGNRRDETRRGAASDRDEDSEDESEENSEEESQSEEEGRKYSLRDRGGIKRTTMNVTQLGGDGGGSARSSTRMTRHDYGSSTINYKDPPSRLRSGSRHPISPDRRRGSKRHRSGRRRDHRNRDYSSRRHFDSSSESSSSSGSDRRWSHRHKKNKNKSMWDHEPRQSMFGEEDDFFHHERSRQQRELESIQPMFGGGNSNNISGGFGMGGSVMDKTSKRDVAKADARPVGVDPNIGFHSVGGLDGHIRALKEMVVLPLLYPDLFSRFDTQPPRGVLFVGPPGTGKTLTARALVNSLSGSPPSAVETTANGRTQLPSEWGGGRKVSFFMRKGADCLSKWVGEGERQLRLLFEQVSDFFILCLLFI